MKNKALKRIISFFTTIAFMSAMLGLSTAASAESGSVISYNFTGTNASDAGYAEGDITFTIEYFGFKNKLKHFLPSLI